MKVQSTKLSVGRFFTCSKCYILLVLPPGGRYNRAMKTKQLPYCRRCDLEINDGVAGMYCVCTRRRQEEEAEKAEYLRISRLLAQQAALNIGDGRDRRRPHTPG